MVMAEGFPGGYTLNYLYGRFNQQNMLDEIRKQQYDFIIVSFKHENTNYGNGSLADSAMLVVDCIRQAIGKRTGDEKLVVGGASMGGLVSRYALTYMEQEVIDHQCKQFITFDSPHRGAYIPVANQWFLRMFEDQSSTAKEGVAMLNTMAARQMLLYYVRDWKPGSGNLVHEEHIRFFASLRALGNYPEEPRKLALTDGRGDGKLQESEGAALRWSYKFETVAVWANLINLPHMKSDWETCARAYHVGIDFWHSYYLNVRNTIGYDGSPGGLGDTTKRIANGFEAICSVGSTLYFGFPCFIPSISALGIDRNDPWVDISSLPRDVSAFDDFVYNDKNITHTDVTVAMRDWLLKYLSTTETVDA